MAKNIVICLDGTGNQVKVSGSSNVVKILELLELDDPTLQIAYYDPGVGTFASPSAWSAPARWLSRLGGLIVGNGLRQNIGEAYSFLMNNWEPNDKLFIFGFSRGAYTARALAGMIHRIGLLRPGSENLVPYAVSVYARRRSEDPDLAGDAGWRRMDAFSTALARTAHGRSRSVPVHFMGLFDTVKAANVLGRDLKWPYTRSLPNVAEVRHAVSIDEKRRPYREYVVEPKGGKPPIVAQTWFAGVHSDVGGAFPDDAGLGRIALRWIVDGGAAAGLLIRPRMLRERYTLTAQDAFGTSHRMGVLWALLVNRRRRLPHGAHVHRSVHDRIGREPEYAKRMPEGVLWDVASWPFE